jgi:hypothetical protein
MNKRDAAIFRAKWREKELRAIHRHMFKKHGATWERFAKALGNSFAGRNALNPVDVPPDKLGKVLKFGLSGRLDIEKKETAFGIARGWCRRNGEPYRFRFRTIECCDKTPDEVRKFYKRRGNAELAARRKAERTEKAMQTNTLTEDQPGFGLDLKAARMALTRAQIDALEKAIDDEWRTLADLMIRVRRDPSWRNVDQAKMRRTMIDRLDMLGDEIENGQAPGPRGSFFRLVRRKSTPCATA